MAASIEGFLTPLIKTRQIYYAMRIWIMAALQFASIFKMFVVITSNNTDHMIWYETYQFFHNRTNLWNKLSQVGQRTCLFDNRNYFIWRMSNSGRKFGVEPVKETLPLVMVKRLVKWTKTRGGETIMTLHKIHKSLKNYQGTNS